MNTIRLGVVGLGNMGQTISKCKVDGMKFAAVCSGKEQAREIVDVLFGTDCLLFTDYTELIDSGAVDALYIATPHYTHPEIAIAAFEAGLHVMLEKPAGAYTEQVEELNAVAAVHCDRVFGIMFNQRYRPEHQKLYEILNSGEAGTIMRSSWVITDWFRSDAYYSSSNWRATWRGEGGGVLLNQCPHNLDLWQWFCGMPVKVLACCRFGVHHDIEVEDDVVLLTEYENGATGSFIASTGEAPGSNRLEIATTRGKLLLEGSKLTWWRTAEDVRQFCSSSPEGFEQPAVEEIVYDFPAYRDEHEAALANFAAAILSDEELLVRGEDGLKSLSIANAAYLSAWRGNCWVEFPLDSAEYYVALREKLL